MRRQDVLNQYFFWLTELVCDERHQRYYQHLLETLHETEFIWTVNNDENRAADGINLRARFSEDKGLDFRECRDILDGPCSLLEMMVGLACRCEDSIMGDEEYGDRTAKWFWIMIHNLELYDEDDGRYDDEYVQFVIESLLYRTYQRNGKGGLFYIKNCRRDLRKVEIWYQMCWYLNTIVEIDGKE